MTSPTFGTGSGGDVTVNATESVELIGVAPVAFQPSFLGAITLNVGDAGSLAINTSRLVVRDGGRVDSSTIATGSAGSITINASESVEVSGTVPGSKNPSLIISSANILDENLQQLFRVPSVPSGASGDVTIITEQLSVTDGALVTVKNDGLGNAGTLRVNARSIFLDNQGGLTAATASGEGGNITLKAQELLQLRRNSEISATASTEGGGGNGGNITIDTDLIVALEDSDITANAFEGQGGNIEINTQGDFRSLDSEITATSQLGIEGQVEINTPDVEVQNSLTQLLANFVSPDQVVAGSCLARRNVEHGSFTVTGTGGLPRNPYEAISGRYTVAGIQPLQGSSNVSSRAAVVETTAWKRGDPIQEAQGMAVTADGHTIVGTTPQLVALAKAQNLVCHSN